MTSNPEASMCSDVTVVADVMPTCRPGQSLNRPGYGVRSLCDVDVPILAHRHVGSNRADRPGRNTDFGCNGVAVKTPLSKQSENPGPVLVRQGGHQ
jgi:hypothetical protein